MGCDSTVSTEVADLRRHILYKRDGERALRPSIADHMLAALDAGAAPDYQVLLRAAQWPDPPDVTFHTAPPQVRADIAAHGLRACQPGDPRTVAPWADHDGIRASQPAGVYLGEDPDTAGRWARQATWDVWAVRSAGFPWQPDTLNVRCWVVTVDIPAENLILHGTYGDTLF